MSAPPSSADPLRYCEDLVAPAGSTAYYSLLFTPAPQRDELLAIQAWRLELAGLLSKSSDPSMARHKLAWWAEELTRAAGGEPRHPVTRALRAVLTRPHASESLARMLVATAERFQLRTMATFDDLEQHCARTAGEAGRLGARVCGASRAQDIGAAGRLAVVIELATMLHSTPRDRLGRGRLLPLEELQSAGVRLSDLEARSTPPALRDWLAGHAERIGRTLDEAAAAFPPGVRHAQHHALILAAIARTQLAALARARYRVLERPAGITPVRKLWIAWRVHRRERAQASETRGD